MRDLSSLPSPVHVKLGQDADAWQATGKSIRASDVDAWGTPAFIKVGALNGELRALNTLESGSVLATSDLQDESRTFGAPPGLGMGLPPGLEIPPEKRLPPGLACDPLPIGEPIARVKSGPPGLGCDPLPIGEPLARVQSGPPPGIFMAPPYLPPPQLPSPTAPPPVPTGMAQVDRGDSQSAFVSTSVSSSPKAIHNAQDSKMQGNVNVVSSSGNLEEGNSRTVRWAADAKKLASKDKQVVSPEFDIDIPGCGVQPFRIVLYPMAKNQSRGGACFKKAKGHGRVELKCVAQLSDTPSLSVSFGISKDLTPCYRGPVAHDFSQHNTCSLPVDDEEWDFSSVVDVNNIFNVFVEVACKSLSKKA